MRSLVLALMLAASLATALRGQLASTTSLVGNATDSSGAAVAGASVTALNTGTQETYTARTSDDGYYEIPFVKPGTYRITLQREGFESVTITDVPVSNNQTARTDFTLKVGAVSQSVVITADAPPINTEDAAILETISTKTVVELPLNGRNPLRIALTVPTVIPGLKSPAGNPGGGEGYIGAGTREIQNSVSMDGVSIMNNLITTTTFRPSPDAVQEVQVQTGTYPAQYGGYLGVQVNVITKSGTNQLHGAAFEFVRNNAFDARNYFNVRPQPQATLRQNQFGFNLNGPVVIPKLYDGRNRTFFMTSYEGLRQSQGVSQIDSVLTARMRRGDFSELLTLPTPIVVRDPLTQQPFQGNIVPSDRLSPQAQRALQYMPLPNAAGTANGTANNFVANVPNRNTTNQTINRVDQSFGEGVRLFFRHAWGNTDLINGNTNPFNGYTQPVRDRNWVAGYTQVFSPSVINDFRAGRQDTRIDSENFFTSDLPADAGTQIGIPGFTTDENNPGLPNLGIQNYVAIGGQNMASSNWYQTDRTWQFSDLLNVTRGAHSMILGADFRQVTTRRTANNSPRGSFTFSGQLSNFGAADFILGLPFQVNTPGPLVPGGAAQWRNGFFIQDKWQVSAKLTLTLGLRYELPTVPQSVTGNGTILNPEQTAFIPAQVPAKIPFHDADRNNIAPRVGFAYRFLDRWVARGGFGIYYNPNQLNSYTLATTNPPFSTIFSYFSTTTAPLTLNNPTPSSAQGAAPRPNAFHINPYLPNATMNQWSFSLERGLWRNAGLDIQYLGSRSYHLDRSFFPNTPQPGPGIINDRRPNQRFAVIRVIQNDAVASYNGLSVVLRQQYARGLNALVSYTWSHTLDVSTDSNGGGATMNPFDWRRDYGNANWDLRHRFVASYDYELPFFRGASQPLLRYALGGWQVNGITTIQSGFPYSVTYPIDTSNTGSANRPDLVGPVTENCGGSQLTNCISRSSFARPQQFTWGNLGRNTLRGPGLINFDFSTFKNFPLGGERARLQFRAEAFNLFNHPSFGNPNAVFENQAFGSITSTQSTARQLQFALKLLF